MAGGSGRIRPAVGAAFSPALSDRCVAAPGRAAVAQHRPHLRRPTLRARGLSPKPLFSCR